MGIRPWERWTIAVVLVLLACVHTSLARHTGITVDEPVHLVTAHLYWMGADRVGAGDLPPLIKIVGGWVPHLSGLRLPKPVEQIRDGEPEWELGMAMMSGMRPEESHRLFFRVRMLMLIFPAGCCLLLWWWGRQLFGPVAGVLAALACALSPNVLGHGALFKNDVAAAFAHLLFWYCAWCYWRTLTLRRVTWMAGALALAMMTKFSLLVLAPVALLVWFVRSPRRPAALALLVLIPWLAILTAYQFQIARLDPHQYALWKADRHIPRLLLGVVKWGSRLPTPPRFWTGAMSLVQSNEANRVYLLGQVYPGGHPLYFLAALAFKIPIAIQLLVLAGLIAVALAWRRLVWTDVFWLAPGFLYVFLASRSNLQLGVRLVLPSIVFLHLLAARGAQWLWTAKPSRVAAVALMLWLGVRSAVTFPHYLSYFNSWGGGSDNALALLSDSNLDWGQDLAHVAEYVRSHRIPKIRLSYFGAEDPYGYLSDRQLETVYPPWNEACTKGKMRYEPEPGYYAISATLLTGQYFEDRYRDYFAAFRNRQPVAKAGYSIFIYRIE